MSDIQELIHTTTIKAYQRGQRDKETQIIKMLDELKLKAISGETRRMIFSVIHNIQDGQLDAK